LTAILGWSHLLQTNKFDDQSTARARETIESNARSQSQLIDDLLDVSRIITGKLRLDVRSVELIKILEAVIESSRPAADAKTIKFEVALDKSERQVLGDATRLQQVLWNLFSNAVKFTPEGGRVEVRLEHSDTHAQIAVSDSGQGINPQFLSVIFDRFRQADGSTTRKHGGLGLGVAIARHLVEKHGGTISARSEGINKGATFIVSLPLKTANHNHDAAGAGELSSSTGSNKVEFSNCSPVLDGLRVLVVDDEDDTRDLILTLLKQCGADVRGSETAAEALAMFREWSPDLLIADIGLPEEDGYSLLKKVRALDRQSGQIPAVALTAYATHEDRDRVLAAGFQMHIAKPVEPEELLSIIANLAGRSKKV
jgi:CheY-like chemotaxis protein